ncbi:VanZ family protein [Bacillus tianshenii]|uniref:VanZ family protein n=1 Tax=Sutcliffiella tianshenii TaxID=1463404 RepID=UPI001CD3052A|nr:VanZ family protein [Bacillus tianshenii]MCA1320262.1 VanZ family protein [Bacillus tianshenii]
MFLTTVRFCFKLAPFAYMALIWFLSSKPADTYMDTGYSWEGAFKESLHLIEFGILYVMLALFFLIDGKLTTKTNILCAAIAIAYGLTDEIHQSFVPARSATLIDFVKDTIGVLIAYFFIHHAYFGTRFQKLDHLLQKIETTFKKPASLK